MGSHVLTSARGPVRMEWREGTVIGDQVEWTRGGSVGDHTGPCKHL